MIEWFAYLQVAMAVIAGLVCVVAGLARRTPEDLTMGATLLVEALLVVQLVIALLSPLVGNTPTGSVLEFYVYLISALLIPPIVVVWALVERTRWNTVILGVGNLAIAVMVYRMLQIWFVQVG